MTQFNKGDEVYSIHGQAARYVARTSNGHIVEPIYERDEVGDMGDFYGTPETWPEVFTKPPTAKHEAHIAELEKKASELEVRVNTLRQEEYDFKAGVQRRKDIIARHQQLETLEDFLEGRITHMVVNKQYGSGYEIQPIAQALEERDRWNSHIKLVTLYGRRDYGYHWDAKRMLTHYQLGSDSAECYPARSHEHAVQLVTELTDADFAAYRKADKASCWQELTTALKAARSRELYGIPVPDDMQALARASNRAEAERQLKSAKEILGKAQATLAEAEAKVAALAHIGS